MRTSHDASDWVEDIGQATKDHLDKTNETRPIAEGIAYVLLRALQDDVDEADLCGAAPGRALGVSSEWHPDPYPA